MEQAQDSAGNFSRLEVFGFLVQMRCLLSLVFFQVCLCASIFASAEAKLEDSAFIWDFNYPRNVHAANICEVSRGSFLAVFMGGSYEKCPDFSIWLSLLNGTSTWSRPVEILKGLNIETGERLPLWNPILSKLPSGDVALFFKKGKSPRHWSGFFCLSKDFGKTWSEPVELPHGYLGPTKCRPIALPDDSLLCPSSVELTSRGAWFVKFEKLSADFKKWSEGVPRKNFRNFFFFSTGVSAIQPALIRLKDGKLLALCRTRNDFLYATTSEDGGKTWSDLKKTAIPNPNSAIDALSLEDGRILLAGNFDLKKKRGKLSLVATRDLTSYSELFVFEDDDSGEYSYPSIILASDGSLRALYTYKRRHIKYVKLNLK